MSVTKQQLSASNEELRALLAQSYADNKVLSSKLFAAHAERSKWEARARAAQSTIVNTPTTHRLTQLARDYCARHNVRSCTREDIENEPFAREVAQY